MYTLLTYMLPVVSGDDLAYLGLHLCWSLTRLFAFIAGG